MYAPVSTFVLRDMGDYLLGYAAPAGGFAPCMLQLTVDDVPIAAARATRFSAAAQTKSVRLGWCGVRVPGLSTATAIGTELKVRCSVSGRVLWQRRARVPVSSPSIRDRPLTVFEIVARSRAEDEASKLDELRPILQWHHQVLGKASFVEATYETFLGRTAERKVLATFNGVEGDSMEVALNAVLRSAEYKENRMRMLPGPFNEAFRYSLRALDEA